MQAFHQLSQVVGGAPFLGGSDHYAEWLKEAASFGRTQADGLKGLPRQFWEHRVETIISSLMRAEISYLSEKARHKCLIAYVRRLRWKRSCPPLERS